MKNTKDLKQFLLRQIQDLNDGRLSCGEAMASAALAGRIIDCEKLEIQCNDLSRRRELVTIESQSQEEERPRAIHSEAPPSVPFHAACVLEYVKWE